MEHHDANISLLIEVRVSRFGRRLVCLHPKNTLRSSRYPSLAGRALLQSLKTVRLGGSLTKFRLKVFN